MTAETPDEPARTNEGWATAVSLGDRLLTGMVLLLAALIGAIIVLTWFNAFRPIPFAPLAAVILIAVTAVTLHGLRRPLMSPAPTPYEWLLLTILLLTAALLAHHDYKFDVEGGDARTYHWRDIADLCETGHFTQILGYWLPFSAGNVDRVADAFPQGWEALSAIAVLLKAGSHVPYQIADAEHLGQLATFFGIVGWAWFALSITMLARAVGASRSSALTAAVLLCTLPNPTLKSVMQIQEDIPLAAAVCSCLYFLFKYSRARSSGSLAMAIVSFALALAVKPSAPLMVPLMAAAFIGGTYPLLKGKGMHLSPPTTLPFKERRANGNGEQEGVAAGNLISSLKDARVLGAMAALLLVGLFWYVRNIWFSGHLLGAVGPGPQFNLWLTSVTGRYFDTYQFPDHHRVPPVPRAMWSWLFGALITGFTPVVMLAAFAGMAVRTGQREQRIVSTLSVLYFVATCFTPVTACAPHQPVVAWWFDAAVRYWIVPVVLAVVSVSPLLTRYRLVAAIVSLCYFAMAFDYLMAAPKTFKSGAWPI
jgi:hypothetical protein